MAEIRIFVSSKIPEFKNERQGIMNLLSNMMGDKTILALRPWLYEKEVYTGVHAKEVYLPELYKSALYIGLFGNQPSEGTLEEFDKAGEWRIDRHIYVKNSDPDNRAKEITEFIRQNNSLAMRFFEDNEQLYSFIKDDIEKWMERRLGKIAERARRHRELILIREQLRKARREYNDYLKDHPQDKSQNRVWHEAIINSAIEACEDARDFGNPECRRCLGILAGQPGFDVCSHKCEKYLTYIARLRLTPYFVVGKEGPQQEAEVRRWNWWGNRNKEALTDALDRINDLISEIE